MTHTDSPNDASFIHMYILYLYIAGIWRAKLYSIQIVGTLEIETQLQVQFLEYIYIYYIYIYIFNINKFKSIYITFCKYNLAN